MPDKLLDHLIERLESIYKLCSEKGKSRIVGSSLFFVCARDYYHSSENTDHLKVAEVYLIDLCHMELFEHSDEKDEGFLLGVRGLIDMMKDIRKEA